MSFEETLTVDDTEIVIGLGGEIAGETVIFN
jgi:hypothetical protein